MTSARLAIAGILAALFTVLGAGAAQAYPDPTITINDGRLVGGNEYEFTAQGGGVSCEWTVTYLGQTRTGSGTSFSGSFTTPAVEQQRDNPVTATCVYDGGVANASATVTLLPLGGDVTPAAASGVLPNAGGSNLWILVVGGALVLIGAGTFVLARRR